MLRRTHAPGTLELEAVRQIWRLPADVAGEELRAAVEEWQAKRADATGAPRLTTGFLDGTHPIVDAYELKASAT
jgi:hypothetical protein